MYIYNGMILAVTFSNDLRTLFGKRPPASPCPSKYPHQVTKFLLAPLLPVHHLVMN